MLECPKCKQELIKEANSYRCENHHSFDIAKRGYVNLLLGNHKATGDDKDMVKARTVFLSHGYYAPLKDRLIDLLKEKSITILADAGCGQGFYTNAIHDALHCETYGFDLSKYAVDEACKAHNGVFYGVCNIFHMPLSKESCDGVLSVFAPIDIKENNRILKPGGYFIKVGPGPRHLWDMKKELYNDVYENTIETGYEGFTLCHEEQLDYDITLQDAHDIKALFQMTPYYWRTPKESVQHLLSLSTLSTKVSFHITIYRKDEHHG